MRIRAVVLADAVITQPDGKLAIFGAGIDRITPSQFPWSQAQLSVFVSLQGEGDPDRVGTAHELRIRVLNPDSEAIAELGGPFMVTSPFPAQDTGQGLQNGAVVFQQLQFPAEGIYRIEVVVDDGENASIDLHVVLGGPAQGQWMPSGAVAPQA
jgi:hypothetical protein